jgi:hypothetical protein
VVGIGALLMPRPYVAARAAATANGLRTANVSLRGSTPS